jgi:hypothetical protein
MEKLNSYDRCVYTTPPGLCQGTASLHPKEHYLPAGLGNFKDDVRLRNFICLECQNRFSKLEEVFLRNGTEAFFRQILGVRGRKSHQGKNIFVEPTLGLPPLTVKGLHPSVQHDLLWEMTSESEAFLMHQLVFKNSDGTLEYIPIRAGKLLKDLSRFGDSWKSWKLLVCIAGTEHEPELEAALGPAIEGMSSGAADVPEGTELQGEMKAQISLPYVQAVTKIAFHFVLAHFHFSGFEPGFDNLKRFIYSGSGTPRARIVGEILLPQLVPEQVRLRCWSHILTAEFGPDGFFARMQFFAGPHLKPFVWRVDLGPNPSRLLAQMAFGLHFFYYDRPDASGYSGGIKQLRLGPIMQAKL